MVNGEEKINIETVIENQVIPPIENTVDTPVIEAEQVQDEFVELDDERAFQHLKQSRGFEYENLDDFLKPKEVIKEVDRYEGIEFDDDDNQYFQYKKDTNRSRKDFDYLNKNFDEIPLLDLALDKVKKEVGSGFTKEQLTEYLENELSIDFSEELTATEEIKLTKFVKEFKSTLKAEQEKYKTPIEKKPVVPEPSITDDMLRMEDGSLVNKQNYERLQNEHQQYLKDIKSTVNSVTDDSFKVTIDDNGTSKEFEFGYKISDEDMRSAVSKASDIMAYQTARYESDKGINHALILKDLDRTANFDKYMVSTFEKGYAKAIEEFTKIANNTNFNTGNIQNQAPSGVRHVSISDVFNR